jgi:ribonuclease-3
MISEATRLRIEQALGYKFIDPSRLTQALTHASIAESRTASYERLEFLGDAVLGLVVSESLYRRYPDLLEGEMTKIKSVVVSRQTCAAIARSFGFDEMLVLGKGMKVSPRSAASESASGTSLPTSLAAAVLEAIVAAVYLDGGQAAATAVLSPVVDPLIDRAALSGHQDNFKSMLQQYAQQDLKQTPVYRVLLEHGPDHAKYFRVVVELPGQSFEPAWGSTKKQAEQLAALKALRDLGRIDRSEALDARLRAEPALSSPDHPADSQSNP